MNEKLTKKLEEYERINEDSNVNKLLYGSTHADSTHSDSTHSISEHFGGTRSSKKYRNKSRKSRKGRTKKSRKLRTRKYK